MSNFPNVSNVGPKDGFVRGVSISAHQNDGHHHNNRTMREHTHNKKRVKQIRNARLSPLLPPMPMRDTLASAFTNPSHYISGSATDHSRLYPEDHLRIKDMGCTTLRMSIERSYLEPHEGQYNPEAIAYYHAYFRSCVDRGLQVMCTLRHRSVPVWVFDQGDRTVTKTVDDFTRFADFVVREFGHYISHRCTINEPVVYTTMGNVFGQFPHRGTIWDVKRVLGNLAQAHIQVYQLIHKYYPDAQVGLAKSIMHRTESRQSSFWQYVPKQLAYYRNDYFIGLLDGKIDRLGCNYYFHWQTRGRNIHHDDTIPRSDIARPLDQDGFAGALTSIAKRGKPIYVTEHGCADIDDRVRSEYLRQSLATIFAQKQSGLDIRGYCHRTLVDNFERCLGYAPQFGLYARDLDTQARIPKPAVDVYKELIKNYGY